MFIEFFLVRLSVICVGVCTDCKFLECCSLQRVESVEK